MGTVIWRGSQHIAVPLVSVPGGLGVFLVGLSVSLDPFGTYVTEAERSYPPTNTTESR